MPQTLLEHVQTCGDCIAEPIRLVAQRLERELGPVLHCTEDFAEAMIKAGATSVYLAELPTPERDLPLYLTMSLTKELPITATAFCLTCGLSRQHLARLTVLADLPLPETRGKLCWIGRGLHGPLPLPLEERLLLVHQCTFESLGLELLSVEDYARRLQELLP